MIKVILDSETCQGHGRCYSLSPQIFDCDDEGRSVLLLAEPTSAEDIAAARLAAASCPERAITIKEVEECEA